MLSAASRTMLCEVLARLRGLPFLGETEPPSLVSPLFIYFLIFLCLAVLGFSCGTQNL